MRPVVVVGRAVVRAFDNEAVIGDGLAIAEGRERVAVGIEQGKIKIPRTGRVDALFVLKPEFDLQQHAGFLLEGVVPGERDLEAVAFGGAYRWFPEHPDGHVKTP